MLKRLAEKTALKKSLFLRTFFTVFSVLVLVMISVLVIYFNRLRNRMSEEYMALIQASVSNADYYFTQNLQNAANYCVNLYSSVEGTRSRVDLSYSPGRISKVASEIRDTFQIISNVHTVTVVNKYNEEAYTVTNQSMEWFTQSFGEELILELSRRGEDTAPFVWEATERFNHEKKVPLLALFTRTSSKESAFYTGTVVVCLDEEALSRSLFGEVSGSTQYCIINSNGDVVAHSDFRQCGRNLRGQEYIDSVLNGDLSRRKIEKDGRTCEVMVFESASPGYYLLAETLDILEVTRARDNIVFVLSLTVLLTLVCIVLLYFVLRKLFVPLNKMVEQVRSSEVMEGEDSEMDDVRLLEKVNERSEYYIQELRDRERKNEVVKALLKQESVDELMADSGYLREAREHLLILIHIGKEQAEGTGLKVYEEERQRIRTLFRARLSEFGQVDGFEIGFRRLLYVLSYAEGEEEKREQILLNMGDMIYSRASEWPLGGTGFVSLSFRREDREHFTERFNRCESILKTRRLLEPERPLILVEEQDPAEQLKLCSGALLQAARDQDREGYIEKTERLISVFRDLPWKDFCMQVAKISLLISKVRNPERSTEEAEQAVRKMLEKLDSREMLSSWFLSLYEDAAGWLQTVNDHSTIPVLERAVAYIDNHYCENNLNLNFLAENLHISAPYLGKLFHDFSGVSFNDYLLKKRMERAKELLLVRPEASVTSIAEEVGYANGAYFTTSFRNYCGVTPTRFRDYRKETAGTEMKENDGEKGEDHD